MIMNSDCITFFFDVKVSLRHVVSSQEPLLLPRSRRWLRRMGRIVGMLEVFNVGNALEKTHCTHTVLNLETTFFFAGVLWKLRESRNLYQHLSPPQLIMTIINNNKTNINDNLGSSVGVLSHETRSEVAMPLEETERPVSMRKDCNVAYHRKKRSGNLRLSIFFCIIAFENQR